MESKKTDTPESAPTRIQHDDKHFLTQYNRVYQSFSEHPKTMLEVSFETDILRANICRYVAKMEAKGQIGVVKRTICPISKHRAGFYSTNVNLLNLKALQLEFVEYGRK